MKKGDITGNHAGIEKVIIIYYYLELWFPIFLATKDQTVFPWIKKGGGGDGFMMTQAHYIYCACMLSHSVMSDSLQPHGL